MKFSFKIVLLTLLYGILTLSLLITINVSSNLKSSSSYDIVCNEFKVDITLADNGDAYVKYNLDTFINSSFSVRFYAFERSNYSMEFVSVKIDNILYDKTNTRAPLDDYNPVSYYYKYYFEVVENEYIVEYYFPRISKKSQNVELEFVLKDFVKVYNDVADLYYMIIKEFDMPIYDMNVNITLPSEVEIDNLYAFGYGIVDGVIGENKTSFSAKNINVGEKFEIRLLMPSEIFTNAPKINKTILNLVLRENEHYLFMTKLDGYYLYAAFILLYLTLTISFLYSHNLKRKFPRFMGINFHSVNEVPTNIDVVLAGKLNQYYKMNNDANIFTATLLNLASKKKIKINDNGEKKNVMFSYTLVDSTNLTQYEEKIINLFFNIVGKGINTITDKQIETYATKNPQSFSSYMKSIYHSYTAYFNQQNWEDIEMSKNDPKRFSPLLLVICLIIISFITMNLFSNARLLLIGSIINFFLCIIAILIASGFLFKRLNQNGENDHAQINDFYNYLNKFTLINEKQYNDIIMWEQYLVYATAFGISSKVLKQLEIKFKDVSFTKTYNNSYLYTFYLLNSRGVTPSTAINTITTSTFAPSRYMSSSGGGKGGFSSGGGGGMGGGRSGGR